MWAEIVRELAGFTSAVLTGRDADGYPFSVRCRPAPDAAARVLRVELPPDTSIQPGPANLLCHRHDQQLWNQRSFLVRGVLARDGGGWAFQPCQLIPGIGFGGPAGLVRFVVGSRRTAARYLAARGLPRPRVPWGAINAIKAEVEREARAARR